MLARQTTMTSNKGSNVISVDFGQKKPKAPAPRSQSSRDMDKYDQFLAWLENGIIMVTFRLGAEGVKAPAEFANNEFLSLNFANEFQVHDFNYNDKGVWATLSFDSGDHFCYVPWSSVVSLYSPTLGEVRSWV